MEASKYKGQCSIANGINSIMNILDLGCGEKKVKDAIGLDNVQLPNVDVVHDLLNFPYPFESNSFNKIYLRHVIEHFNIEQINQILIECDRLIESSGEIIISVPHVFSISAFIDPTHRSFFTFGSGQYWDSQSSKAYYKSLKINWKLIKTTCKVTWFDWKGYQMKKLDRILSNLVEKRLERAIKSVSNPCKADRIIKKSSIHFVEIEWVFEKVFNKQKNDQG